MSETETNEVPVDEAEQEQPQVDETAESPEPETTVSDAIEESRPDEEPEAADVPLTQDEKRKAAQKGMANNMRAKARRLKG